MLRAALLVILVQAPSSGSVQRSTSTATKCEYESILVLFCVISTTQTNQQTNSKFLSRFPAETGRDQQTPYRCLGGIFGASFSLLPSSVASLHGAPVWRRRGKVSAECFRVRVSTSKNMARHQLNVG
ncbi:hypothetical protein M431DRAFT_312481 [Trichoderma harzianum CBS 226.95]|uniref:Secreted protein n=1 Tax=Trichoderma harzianum CBS 226.95 TaxID=983964 RepID=A0A2T4ARK1_TRIHA|nr:hypothetical protein M431DRAFT_312481 [Trichoderma harzianum CBS 226.95]PTB59705.1 hypothetical protein M431DRAFT_312481 [Trichoderma harzianum CBS 226.95]